MQKRSLQGVRIPMLTDVTKMVGVLKESALTKKELNEEEQKGIELALQYAAIQKNQANAYMLVRGQVEETSKTLKTRLPALQAELATLQKQIRHRSMESSEIGQQANLLRHRSDLLLQDMKSGKSLTREFELQTGELEKQVHVLKSEAKTIMADTPFGAGGTETFWERRFGWFVAGSVFYGTMRAAKNMLETAKEIESSMTLIRRISNETTADFQAMQKALLDLGVQYGHTWDVVSDVAERWARAGYSVRDTLMLTEVGLVTLNTAELNAVEATESMVAIMSQWGMTAHELLPMLDKITMAADNYSVSSADLIQGLSRASGAAKNWNMTMEETIAILTVLRESSGRTGREIGNVLNTLLAFMKRAETIRTFKAVGIDIYTDSTGAQYRNVMDIFAELAEKLPSMSDATANSLVNAAEAAGLFNEEVAMLTGTMEQLTLAQEQNIATSVAGTRRQNYLIAMLKNWTTVDEVLLDLEESLGYSLKSNAQAMNTYEKQLQRLRASWQQLSDTYQQTGILDTLTGMVKGATAVLGVFNDLPAPIRAAAGAIATLTAAIAMLNIAAKTFTKSSIIELARSAGGIVSAKGALGLLTSITSKIPGPAMGLGLGLATGVTVGEIVRRQVEQIRQLNEMAKAYAKATRNLEELEEGTTRYNRAAREKQSLMNSIGERFPNLIEGIDEFGNVTSLAMEHMKGFSQGLKEAEQPMETLEQQINAVNWELRQLAENWGQAQMPESFLAGDTDPYGVFRDTLLDPERRTLEARQELANQLLLQEQERQRLFLMTEHERLHQESVDGAVGAPLGFDIVEWREQLRMLEDPSIDLALTNLRRDIRLLALAENELKDAILDEAKIKEVAAEKAKLLTRENQLLASANAELYRKLSVYKRAQQEANEAMSGPNRQEAMQAYNEASSQIKSLTSSIADNTVKIRENEIAMENAGKTLVDQYKKIRSEQQKIADEMFRLQKSFFTHEVDLGRVNRDTQIKFYRELLVAYQDDAEKRMEIEKRLQSLYREGLEEEMQLAERAYRERLRQIDDEADARIKAIQLQIEALDELDEHATREEAARQHAEKISDIEEQIHYHSLRTGREHEKAIADLKKQKSEEMIRWELQQDKWARSDRKAELQQRINDIREFANSQKEELQKAWEDTQEMFKNEMSVVFATASLYDDMWFQKGLNWIQQLALGMQAGAAHVRAVLSSIGLDEARGVSDVVGRSQALLQAKRDWERAYAIGDTDAMARAVEAGKAIRAAGPTLDPDNKLTGDELQEAIRRATFHVGGKNLRTGFALLSQDERVLTPAANLRLERLVLALEKQQFPATSQVLHIDTLVSIDEAHFQDKADMQALADMLERRIKILMTSRGRGNAI